MLSFMREQGAGDLPGSQGAGQHGAGGPDQNDAQEYLTVAANSKSLRRSSILVMVLVAAGLAGLLFMIRKSQPQSASAASAEDESKIEVAIGRLTGVSAEMVSRMDEIVKRFYEFSDVFQVGVTELTKNPFEAEAFASAIKEDGGKAQDDKAKAALILREKLKQRASTLKLLSVMRSEQGDCCMINDRILRQGETIEGFTISEIRGDSVELTCLPKTSADDAEEADALTIQLKLAQ